MKKPALGAAALALAALSAFTACKGDSAPDPDARCTPQGGTVSVGEKIPLDCSFERLDGGSFRLAELSGTPAVINFWAAWCTFCIEEMPAFQRVYASLGGRVQFVGANLLDVEGETRGAAETFGRRTGVRYLLIYDKGGLLYAHFSPRLVMPVTIFVRADGVVAFRQYGPLTEARLREIVATELGVR